MSINSRLATLPSRRAQLCAILPRITQVRTVVIPTKNRKNNSRPGRRIKHKTLFEDYKLRNEEKRLDKRIQQIQELVRDLKLEMKRKQEQEVQSEIKDLEKPVEDEDVDAVYAELLGNDSLQKNKLLPSGEKSISLFDQPAKGISIPPVFLERMGDSVREIVSKENQNWNQVVQDLHTNKSGFSDISPQDIREFLKQIPTGRLSLERIETVKSMLSEVGIKYDAYIYHILMKHLAEANQPTQVQALFDQAVADGITPNLSMYAHLVKAYARLKNIDRVNLTLDRIYKQGLEPNTVIYSNVLRLCLDLQGYEKADEIFQMMKFRSTISKPDIETYNIMLESCEKRNDFYRANDLYQELLDEGLIPTVFTFNMLAKVCSRNKTHLIKGWGCIIEINERNLEPDVSTFEAMLRLAAKDGDLELARALYLKIFEMQAYRGRYDQMDEPFLFLLMAYRDFRADKKSSLLHYEQGAIIRRNTIGLINFLGLNQNIVDDTLLAKQREKYPPLLPSRLLLSAKQIIAESNAVWAYHMLNNPKSIQTANYVTYLRIAVEHDDKEEFIRRFETFSYQNEEIDKNKMFVIEDADSVASETELEGNDHAKPLALKTVEDNNIRIERNSEIYTTVLSAGRRFKDSELCEKAWVERGKYRRTITYQKIPERVRKDLDYKFAYEMVLALLELDLVYDAVHVVKSSQRQFKWTYYALKPLHLRLIDLGDEKAAHVISTICNVSSAH